MFADGHGELGANSLTQGNPSMCVLKQFYPPLPRHLEAYKQKKKWIGQASLLKS